MDFITEIANVYDYIKELDELLNKFDQKELVENQEIIKLKTTAMLGLHIFRAEELIKLGVEL